MYKCPKCNFMSKTLLGLYDLVADGTIKDEVV